MSLLFIIIIVVLLFGGGGFYTYRSGGFATGGGGIPNVIWIFLVIFIILALFGYVGHGYYG